MMKLFALSLALLMGSAVQAQSGQLEFDENPQKHESALEIARYANSDRLAYFKFREGRAPNSGRFFDFLVEELELAEPITFKLRNRSEDQVGFTHDRYEQYYHDFKVEMAWLNVHVQNDRITSFNGDFVSRPKVDLSNGMREENALQAALKYVGASIYKWEIKAEEAHLKLEMEDPSATYYPKAELVLINKELDLEKKLELCYAFNIYAQKPLGRYKVFVNASKGYLVYMESMLHTGDSPGTAMTAYSDTVNIVTDSLGQAYRLRESGRGNGIETYDLNTSTLYNQATDFIDSNNIWNTFPANSLDRYATDAHFGTEMTYDYFSLVHNRNSIDGLGFRLRSYVHYGVNYANAFWDGQRMTYGDGDGGAFNPLTTLDICGHEVAHGLTDFTSDLIYAYEWGALNESFSDIFGATVENYARPNNWNWLIGEDMGSAIRNMANPKQFGDPDTYEGQNWISQLNCVSSGSNDYCGVHTNSGVQNYWFYLLSEGGSGMNDFGQSYQVDSIGILKAGKIAFRNNTVYLGRTSNYAQARFFAIRAAIDLYGACSKEVEAVTNAWYAVGVGNAYSPGVSADFVAVLDTSYCTVPATVSFDSDGSNAISFNWDFGDGISSTLPDPVHTYNAGGTYNVSLIVDGGSCGADTLNKNAYINIDTALNCSYYMGIDRVASDCNGLLYDEGGLNASPAFNSLDTFEIAVLSANQLLITFRDFDIESGNQSYCNKDFILIYDGAIGSRIIGKYCNNNLPPDSILSSTNQLTVVYSSDQSNPSPGFSMQWECRNATAAPTADFHTPLDTVCNGMVSFSDRSLGGASSWSWDFGDGNTSTARNPIHFYQADGTYTVSLTVSNAQGANTITKSNVITIQRSSAPTVSNDTVCVGETARLVVSGNGNLQWFTNPRGLNSFYRGANLNVQDLRTDTSFYVQYEQANSAVIGSPFIIPGSGYYADSVEVMYFDVFEPIVLESVILDPQFAGERRIELRNSNGDLLQSTRVNVLTNPIQVTIGFTIYPDTAYQLLVASPDPGLYVNSSGASYPYNMNGLMELTGSSLGANAYPFFYYWTVKPLSCFSNRVEVGGIVDTSCTLVSIDQSEAPSSRLGIFPNPSTEGFTVSGFEYLDSEAIIEVFSVQGKLVSSSRFSSAEELNDRMFGQSLPTAIYLIRITIDRDQQQFKWVKTK